MKTRIIPIIIIGILALAGLAAAAPTCPPDLAIKWYALMSYVAYASGQNAAQLIAQAQAAGNVTVVISGTPITIPYCSTNATAANGTKIFFVPAVGVGELKKAGLNITQAKEVFIKLKEARMQALANLTRYLKPVEGLGLREAAEAVLKDKGYAVAAEANANASALLKELGQIMAKAGVGQEMVQEVLASARQHEALAEALISLKAAGGLRGINASAAANVSAVIESDSGYNMTAQNLMAVASRLKALADILLTTSPVAYERLAGAAENLNETANMILAIKSRGGLRGIEAGVNESAAAALSGTLGIDNAIARVNSTLSTLESVLRLLRSVNASSRAIIAVETAISRHERALEVLEALKQAGGLQGLEQGIYSAIEEGSMPQIVGYLCIDLNITEALQEYGVKGNATLPYAIACNLAILFNPGKYAEKTGRPVYIPMAVLGTLRESLKAYLDAHGGFSMLQNIEGLEMLWKILLELEAKNGVVLPGIVGVNITTSGASVGGNVTVGIGGSAGGNVTISGGGSMGGSGNIGGSGSGIGGSGSMGGNASGSMSGGMGGGMP
ncbi:hypothetical protein [Thermoproteus tenax]|uniref:Uncharacterized protein n=1 Tax=Thermoproteus tenax (strain ATCC 35583 / DSM 2078 / JCM 9277 / NBRC 100435 / Kra 1) TaxID=768679 RepID=G4RQ58_THETK|nr:hypothetical protein [Thermoproteus tenax]CCC80695.1 hypothetical protein TTX_0017 [Thermoproteus tenax Kra 1]